MFVSFLNSGVLRRPKERRCFIDPPRILLNHSLSLLAITCMIFVTPCSQAQNKGTDLTDLTVDQLQNIRIYSASKHLQSSSDAPSSVTVITARDIEQYGYRDLAEILESVRGFYIAYDRDYSFVGVRGFGHLGDWNSRVLLLVDGHRINDNVLGQAMLGSEFLVDIDMIDRIEIIRGPSSSLYGANAFFAVINVITRKPNQSRGIELSFAPGSFASYEGRATYSGPLKNADVLLSDTFYNSSGPTLFFPEFDTPGTNFGVTRNTDYESTQHALATLAYRGFTLQGLYSTRDKGVPTAYFGGAFNDPRTQNYDDHAYLDVSYEHSINENWNLRLRTSYDQATDDAPVASQTSSTGAVLVNRFGFRGNGSDSEAQLSRTLFEKHNLSIGSEVTDNIEQNQADFTASTSSFVRVKTSSLIWALYGQDEFAITPELILNAGVRYDHYYTFGGTTNPRLGVIYHFNPHTTGKLLYGTAFRPPEPYETYPDYGLFYANNLQLTPETIRSGEAVVERALGEHFSLSASVFRNDIRHLITLTSDAGSGLSHYENFGSARATGAEFELGGELGKGLRGSASYSFTDAKSGVTSVPLDNSPKHLAKINLSLPLWRQKLSASTNAQYTSTRGTLAGGEIGGFGVINATLVAHTFDKHMELSASVYNLFDKNYFDPGRPEDIQDRIQQDGRTFRLKIIARF